VVLTLPASDITTLRFQAAHMRSADLRVEVLRD
jgi:hypothetical protein